MHAPVPAPRRYQKLFQSIGCGCLRYAANFADEDFAGMPWLGLSCTSVTPFGGGQAGAVDPQFAALRSWVFAGAVPQATPQVLFLGGGAGADKSGVLRVLQQSQLFPPTGAFVTIDPDVLMTNLTSWAALSASGNCGEVNGFPAAMGYADSLLSFALSMRYNVLFTSHLSSGESTTSRLQRAASAGYAPLLVGVFMPTQLSAIAEMSGWPNRMVEPLDVVVGTAVGFSANFFSYAPLASRTQLYSVSDVAATPVLVMDGAAVVNPPLLGTFLAQAQMTTDGVASVLTTATSTAYAGYHCECNRAVASRTQDDFTSSPWSMTCAGPVAAFFATPSNGWMAATIVLLLMLIITGVVACMRFKARGRAGAGPAPQKLSEAV